MLASTWFDLVVGLDLHIVLVPAPPSPAPIPTPMPLPFVGTVFDGVGQLVGALVDRARGAKPPNPVLINGVPATVTGADVMGVPHVVPPPLTLMPPPDNDALLLFGSKTVKIQGSHAVRLGEVALSCSSPVRIPSAMVLALPAGRPVLLGGPPGARDRPRIGR
jgi:uncharacterized Zn-binding protein involved in type VI secretion